MRDIQPTTTVKLRIAHRFGLQAESETEWSQLHTALCERIVYYLQRQPELFFQLMYQLDIDEASLHQHLKDGNLTKIADLIITREIERLRWRQQYASIHHSQHSGRKEN